MNRLLVQINYAFMTPSHSRPFESSIRSWCTSSLCQSKVVGIIWLKWRQKLTVQMSANTTHQEVLQLFTPKQLVETGNETLLGQWGLLRTRNGEGHLVGVYEGLDWVPRTLSSKK